jgi:hypothetical protein
MTLNTVSDAESDPELCPHKRCTLRGREALDDAEMLGLISTITFATGVAALGTGTVLILTAPGENREQASLELRPFASPWLSGVSARGRF